MDGWVGDEGMDGWMEDGRWMSRVGEKTDRWWMGAGWTGGVVGG